MEESVRTDAATDADGGFGAVDGRRPFKLGGWLVDPSLNRVTGDDQTFQVEPKVMDVLACLVRHAGSVVSKQQLIDTVWQSDFVTEGVLTRAIGELRSLLGDNARDPRYIETIPKRGYRLIAELNQVEARTPPDVSPIAPAIGGARRRLAVVISGVAGSALVAIALWLVFGSGTSRARHPASTSFGVAPRIVVLPFSNLGPDDEAYFAFGMAEEITSRLGAVSGLEVISRTTAFNYDRSGKTVRQIGADLDVDFVLEGSVRWEEDDNHGRRVRITPQLIRVSDDSRIWGTSYDRYLDDVFEVQTEIGRRIVAQLDIRLLASEQRAIEDHPTQDFDAYQVYLRGCGHLFSDEAQDFEQAVAYLDRAVDLAPDFARAHARLSTAHASLFHYGYDTSQDRLERARHAIDRALELKPDLPEVRNALGFYFFCARDLERALAEFQAAAAAQPNDSQAVAGIGYVQMRQGRWQESIDHLDHALELDPLNPRHLWNKGTCLTLLRRYDEAELAFNQAIEAAPGMRTPYLWKAFNYLLWDGSTRRARTTLADMPGPHDGRWLWRTFRSEVFDRRYRDALELARASQVEEYDLNTPTWTMECFCLLQLGDVGRAAATCGRALELLEDEARQQSRSYWVRVELAKVHALLGHREQALREAERARSLIPEPRDAVMGPALDVDLAQVHALVGDIEGAIDLLEGALAIPSPLSPGLLSMDPVWDPIRHHPRFQRLIEGTPR
jgi:TolB-like protein/DNA-binding winged helix-turn-helix (wHTH) protein/Flp pilus assembly protein TadD